MSDLLNGLRHYVLGNGRMVQVITPDGYVLDRHVRDVLRDPPQATLDAMMDEYDEHTSLVDSRGYFCVARDCEHRSDTADLARRHAMQRALAAAAGGDR